MLLDSNIIIYAAKPDYAALRQFIAEHSPVVSVISYVEVLGYHRLTVQERQLFEAFFTTTHILAVIPEVIDYAVQLRQQRKMTLGDALIAGTALAHQFTLATRNARDFEWIPELTVLNPFT